MGSQRGQSGLRWLNHLAPPPKTNTLRHLCVYVGVNKFSFKSFVICLNWNSPWMHVVCRNVASCVIYKKKKKKKTGVRCIVNFVLGKKKREVKSQTWIEVPAATEAPAVQFYSMCESSTLTDKAQETIQKCSFWKWRAREGERSHSLITVSLQGLCFTLRGLDRCHGDKYKWCESWRRGNNPEIAILHYVQYPTWDGAFLYIYSRCCPPHPVVCLSSEFKNVCSDFAAFFFGGVRSSWIFFFSPPTTHPPTPPITQHPGQGCLFSLMAAVSFIVSPPTMHCADGAWSLSPGRLFVQHEKGGFGLRSLP